MANNKRTIGSVMKGVWIRSLSILARISFPAQVTTALHRMRGMHIGQGANYFVIKGISPFMSVESQ